MSAHPRVTCPKCGSEAQRVFETSGIVFQGLASITRTRRARSSLLSGGCERDRGVRWRRGLFCGERSGGSRTRPIHPCHGLTCESSKAYLPDRRKSPRQSQSVGPWVSEGEGASPSGMGRSRDGGRFLGEVKSWHHVLGTTAGPVSEVARRVCTRHTTSDTNPSLPPRFPSWWHAINPAPVRKPRPACTRGQDIRHEGHLRPRQGQKFRPTCTHGTRFPTWTRQDGTFPCWSEVSLSPQSESPSRVYTRDGISGTCPMDNWQRKRMPKVADPQRARMATCRQREDWSTSRRQQAPTPRGETTPIVRPPVFPERFSLHARQPGRNFNVRMAAEPSMIWERIRGAPETE